MHCCDPALLVLLKHFQRKLLKVYCSMTVHAGPAYHDRKTGPETTIYSQLATKYVYAKTSHDSPRLLSCEPSVSVCSPRVVIHLCLKIDLRPIFIDSKLLSKLLLSYSNSFLRSRYL